MMGAGTALSATSSTRCAVALRERERKRECVAEPLGAGRSGESESKCVVEARVRVAHCVRTLWWCW